MDKVLFITHSEAASPGNIDVGIKALGFETVICCPMLGDRLPSLKNGKPEEFIATVVFGGPQLISQEGKTGYLLDEIQWVGEQVRSNSPLLGICLGAQIIAASYGCTVGPHTDGVREIGFHPVRGLPAGQDIFLEETLFYQWHREGFELPSESTLLATNETFPNQAFSIGSRVYGIQFHPEITLETMERWITSEQGAPQLSLPGAQSAVLQRELAPKSIHQMKCWLQPFLNRWLDNI